MKLLSCGVRLKHDHHFESPWMILFSSSRDSQNGNKIVKAETRKKESENEISRDIFL